MRSRVARAARESDEILTEMTFFSYIIIRLVYYPVLSLKPANIITDFVAGDNELNAYVATKQHQSFFCN